MQIDEKVSRLSDIRARKFALLEVIRRNTEKAQVLENEECALLRELLADYGPDCDVSADVMTQAAAPKERPTNDVGDD